MDLTTMLVIAALAATAIVAALFRTMGLRSFRQTVMTGAPGAFNRMLLQSGLSPHDAVGREYDLAVAAARCSSCASPRECAALLDAGRLRDARALCPNAAFFGQLECANARHSERKRGQTFLNLLLFLFYVAIMLVVAYFFWGLLA